MIQTLLFVAGINTLLQTWFGTRLPVVVGAFYAFIIPAVSIALSSRMSVFPDPHQVSVFRVLRCGRNCGCRPQFETMSVYMLLCNN